MPSRGRLRRRRRGSMDSAGHDADPVEAVDVAAALDELGGQLEAGVHRGACNRSLEQGRGKLSGEGSGRLRVELLVSLHICPRHATVHASACFSLLFADYSKPIFSPLEPDRIKELSSRGEPLRRACSKDLYFRPWRVVSKLTVVLINHFEQSHNQVFIILVRIATERANAKQQGIIAICKGARPRLRYPRGIAGRVNHPCVPLSGEVEQSRPKGIIYD
jgi:hypothetical protein